MIFHARTPHGAAALAALVLAALSAPGCYRATGFDRAALIAEEMPAAGGDRVMGAKSMAGAGDYYVGNDFVCLAVDGSPMRGGSGIAGAPGGGGIVDVGFIMLDNSFRRVPAPCDVLDRMTTVVNQDPDVQLVFGEFRAVSESDLARLEMEGMVHDPKHKISGVSGWDQDGFALGVRASASIGLRAMDGYFTLDTAITNDGPSAVGVRSIGDLVYQRGGGFRVLAPVFADHSGAPLSNWGVEMPGTGFSDPLPGSVRSGMVALMGTEPGSDSMDCHVSLGLTPLGSDYFLVATDPQRSMTERRPIFPERFVVGRPAEEGPLAPKGTISHSRRLYVKGGASGALEYLTTLYTQGAANQGTGLLNDMYRDALVAQGKKVSTLRFTLEGTGTRSHPVPSELRFERYIGPGGGDPRTDKDPRNWRLERLEWMEPADSQQDVYVYDASGIPVSVATTPDAYFGVFLPAGTYRIVSSNPSQRTVYQTGANVFGESPNTQAAIALEEASVFSLAEAVSPEYADTRSPDYGTRTSLALVDFSIATRGNDSVAGFVQPMRFAFLGRGGAAPPDFMRKRSITSTFDPNTKTPRLPGPPYSLTVPPGPFHFLGGNSAFGVQLGSPTPLVVSLAPGAYDAYGARGPLSTLEQFAIDARPGLGASGKLLTVFHAGPPEGWLALDLPGPSMATTGGALPCEQLASALAEGVDVVCMAETDHQRDAPALYREFKASLNYLWDANKNVGVFPLAVGGRQSELTDTGFGTATALFAPVDPGARLGGARPSGGWTLADFLAQAEGQFNVVNRPRGPQGLFRVRNFNPAQPLPQWWRRDGPLSQGRQNGGFDAMEIMSAGSGVGAWWSEFKEARDDWFSIIGQQGRPGDFIKAVGFSGGRFSQDAPVGLARTWLFVGEGRAGQGRTDAVIDQEGYQSAMDDILGALRQGAAVVSSGPLLLVRVGEAGPGALATVGGSPSSVTLDVTLIAPDWVPVDEIRVVVNGKPALLRLAAEDVPTATLANPKAALTRSGEDSRYYTGSIRVTVPSSGDAWLVAEAGAPLGTTGAYRPEAVAWNALMKGIYPVAVTNPIFLDLDGGGYVPPGI